MPTASTVLLGGDAYSTGALAGSGNLTVIDSLGGGGVLLGNTGIQNTYTGGTRVLSGTLEMVNAQAVPDIGVLTVGGPGSIVSSTQAGTLFGNMRRGKRPSSESPVWKSQATSWRPAPPARQLLPWPVA